MNLKEKVKLHILCLIYLILFPALCCSQGNIPEISNLISLPNKWSSIQQPIISWKVEGEDLEYYGLIDTQINEEPDGVWQKLDITAPIWLISPPLEGGEYEVWIKVKDKEGNFSSPKMSKVYIDINPPNPPSNLRVEKIDGEFIILWEPAEDKDSGVAYYEGKINEISFDNVQSGKWKLPKEEGTYNIRVWAVDKVNYKSEVVTLEYTITSPKKEKEQKAKKKKSAMPVEFTGSTVTMSYRKSHMGGGGVGGYVEGYKEGSDFEQSYSINIEKEVENVKVKYHWEDNPSQTTCKLVEIEGKKLKGKGGNFSTNFTGNEFTNFSKNIDGMEVEGKYKPIDFKMVYSQGTSMTKTETIQGALIKGPYKLNAFNILEGSETVILDKGLEGGAISLQRDKDYVMDYFGGYITFKEILSNNWKFTITYEFTFLDFFSRTGDLYGMQTTLKSVFKNPAIITYLREVSDRSGSLTTSYISEPQRESYTGDPQAFQEYILNNWPVVEGTETVCVVEGGICVGKERSVATEKRDYYIDYERGTIRFNKYYYGGSDIYPPGYDGTPKYINISYNYKVAFGRKDNIKDIDGVKTTYPLPFIISEPIVRVWRSNKKQGIEDQLLYNEKISELPSSTNLYYKLDLNNQTITFYNFIPTKDDEIIIEYREIPKIQAEEAEVKREVFSLTHNFNLGNKVSLDLEVAQSNSEKEEFGVVKTISFFGDGTEGPYSVYEKDAKGNPIYLGPVVPSSETVIVFGINNNNPLTRGSGQQGHYYIDYNAGEITFSTNIKPTTNDKIVVTYKYFPEGKSVRGEIQKVKGTALKAKSQLKLIENLNWQVNYRYVEPKFVPVGANRPLPELQGISSSLSYSIGPYFSLMANYDRKKTPEVNYQTLEQTGKINLNESYQGGFTYSPKRLPRLTFTYQTQVNQDNLQPRTLDSENKSYNLNLFYSYKKIKTYSDFRKSKVLNNIRGGSNIYDNFYNLRFEIEPTSRLSFSTNYQYKETENVSPTTTTTNETQATSLETNWQMTSTLRLNSKLDFHKVVDPTHPDGYTTNIANFGLMSMPFKLRGLPLRKKPLPVNSLNLNFTYDKNPSETPPRITKNYYSTFSVSIYPNLTLSPNLSITELSRTGGAGTKSTGWGLNTNWRVGKEKPLNLTFNHNQQESKSMTLDSQKNLITTVRNNYNNSLNCTYPLSKALRLTYNINYQKVKDLSNPSSNYNTIRSYLEPTYIPSKSKNSYRCKIQFEKQDGQANVNKRWNITLGATTKLSDNVNLNGEYLYIDNRVKKGTARSYSASVFTARLEARF